MLIGLWMADEIQFNRSFKNHDRLGQVYHHVTFGEEIMTINDVPAPIGAELKNNYAEFEEVAMASWPAEHLINHGDVKLSNTGLFVEPQFTDMFSVEMLQGSSAGLKEVHSILLSRTLAADLLGENPVGQLIRFDNRDHLVVTGVFEDFPSNSAFAEVKMLMPMAYYFSIGSNREKINNWENYSYQCFVLLRENASFEAVESKIKMMLYDKASNDGKGLNPRGILLPMDKWHLYAEFKNGVNTGGPIRLVKMVGVIGVFVLLLACINFMNLSTARSEKRSKEVGIRKVMGSVRNQLVRQFLIESMLVVVIGFLLALAGAAFSLPWFNDLSGKRITMPWADPVFFLISLVFILMTSLLAGSYPALFLSSFSPVKVLKGTFKVGRFATLPRKVMVVFQFTTSIVLIIGTIVVLLQIEHAKNRPVGFDREGIIHMAIRTEELANVNYNILREDLLSTGVVENMAKSDFPITGAMSGDASLSWQGKDPAFKPLIAMNSCSHDFPKTNGFQFVQGRDFSRDLSTDSSAVIINEMAADLFAGKNVIGEKINFSYGKERVIIGVIKDQIRWSPFSRQTPHVYYINYEGMGYLTIRLNSHAGVHDALAKIEAVIRKHDPLSPFDYKFVDDDYARLFNQEERIRKLASLFSMLAVFISCIGIFGLAAFAASQRTKEIGIRKVMGASVFNLWKMLSVDFVRLVALSIIVAVPLAYYFSNDWLAQYDYRIDVYWWIFVATGILALTITLLTVSYQSIKAARINPVKTLRSE
ncbi:MAG: FtsX-like permease family protein, partial [Bacteroidota bacterium]